MLALIIQQITTASLDICAEIRLHAAGAVLSISVCVPLSHRRGAELQLEAETPGQRYPSVCCSVSVTQWCCVSSERPPTPPSTSSSPATHDTDNTTGSDTDNPQYLMTGASLSLSLSSPFLPFFTLPSNQWTTACKQKSNRLHGWLFGSCANLWSQQVGGFGSLAESGANGLQPAFR